MPTNPTAVLFLTLGIILIGARAAGALARRFGQPRVLGELIIGVILGPTLLNMLGSSLLGTTDLHLFEPIHQLAELGVLMLMFKIGLDVHLSELTQMGRVAALSGVIGAVFPVVLTLPIVVLFGETWQAGLVAGVTLAATSVSISAQVLVDLGVLRTRVGNALLATALVDDVVAILLLSVSFAITSTQGSVQVGDVLMILVRMAVFLVVAFAIAWFVLPRLLNWIHNRPELSQSYGLAGIAIVIALGFGWAAEHFGGVAAITGAFIAGVGISQMRESIKRTIDTAVSSIAYALLVPIFFVSVGLQTNLAQFPLSALPFAGIILVIAVVTKVYGCGWGARVAKMSPREALQLGVCMISRGEVGLIIASQAAARGIFKAGDPLFSVMFLIILLTTLITPVLVRRVFREGSPAHA